MTDIFDPDALVRLGNKNKAQYLAAEPFPHIVLENFLPEPVIDRVLNCFPSKNDPFWTTYNAPESIKQDTTPDLLGEMRLPLPIRDVVWQLNSAMFLYFLHHLTGYRGLLSDPYLFGGGIHQIPPGGMLKMHSDFNYHFFTGMRRRINVLFYLNKNWKEDYGGHLELWTKDMSFCVKRIAPTAGTCVIFNTEHDSYHGHPDPLSCPEGMTRKSIAMYYYTIDPDHDPRDKIRNTNWKRRPGEQY